MSDSVVPAQHNDPSLVKLLHETPQAHYFSHPADSVVLLGNQLERIIYQRRIAAHLAIGTLRFSLFRLHQELLARLVPVCASITVFGEADVAPPAIEGITFVALSAGSQLSQEWFVVVDSPQFWGALLTRVVHDQATNAPRRYLFTGALTAEARIVSRAMLLLHLLQDSTAPAIGPRDWLAHQSRWGEIVAQLATHPDAERLDLPHLLGAQIDLLAVAEQRDAPLQQLLADAVEVIAANEDIAGVVLYRVGEQGYVPIAGRGAKLVALQGHGLVARAMQQQTPQHGSLQHEPEAEALSAASYAVAAPIIAQGQQWGALLVGLLAEDIRAQPGAGIAAGVAGLLGSLLGKRSGEPIIQAEAGAPALLKAQDAELAETAHEDSASQVEQTTEQAPSSADDASAVAANEHLLSRFARNIATSLHALRELIVDLSVTGPLNEQQSRMIGSAMRLNGEILLLLADLETLGDLHAQAPANAQPLDMGQLIEAAAGTLYAEFGRRSQQVTLQIAPELPAVVGSEEGLWRAATALLDNAIKYSPIGAHITVRVGAEQRAVVVSVTNNDTFIAPHELANVFEPLYRAHNAIQANIPGQGLGLALARAVVIQHGGTIWAASDETNGTTFAFRLPTEPSD